MIHQRTRNVRLNRNRLYGVIILPLLLYGTVKNVSSERGGRDFCRTVTALYMESSHYHCGTVHIRIELDRKGKQVKQYINMQPQYVFEGSIVITITYRLENVLTWSRLKGSLLVICNQVMEITITVLWHVRRKDDEDKLFYNISVRTIMINVTA